MKKELKLTPKQIGFCNSYIDTANASEAYRQHYETSHMKSTSVTRKACELMKNDKVKAKIKSLQDELAKKSMITKEDLIMKLMLIANDYQDNKEFTNSSGNEDMRKAEVLSSLANSASSISAIKQVSKMLGFDAPEQIEIDQKITINITKPDFPENRN